jgi:hypothetical protein
MRTPECRLDVRRCWSRKRERYDEDIMVKERPTS